MSPPTNVVAVMNWQVNGDTNVLDLTFTDTNTTESGYEVHRSPDGVTAWEFAGLVPPSDPQSASGGTLLYNEILDAGQDLHYRVRALETGGSPSDWSQVVSPHTPKDRAVELEASEVANGINLSWVDDERTVRWSVYRKLRSEPGWTPLVQNVTYQPGTQSYTDTTAAIGSAYEYQLERFTQDLWGPGTGVGNAYGYVYAGREAPLVEGRGTVLLVVDQTIAPAIAAELNQFSQDLIGDGWTVQRSIDVPRVEVPTGGDPTEYRAAVSLVRAQIKTVWDAAPTQLKAVFLIGHVPVPYSGTTARDNHFDHFGAWVADAFYGDMTADWTTADEVDLLNPTFPENSNFPMDGKFDHNQIPLGASTDPPDISVREIEVPIGRIDFAKMPTFFVNNNPPSPSIQENEIALLKRYLKRVHEFRHGIFSVQARALVDDHFGNSLVSGPNTTSPAEMAWRTFTPLVGEDNLQARDFRNMHTDDYLFAYGDGPGPSDSSAAAGVVDVNDYAGTTGSPPAPRVMKGAFNFLHGSYFGDWDKQNNLLRAVLGGDGFGLTVAFAGGPQWFIHPMGLGEPIGTSLLQTQNNHSGRYRPEGGWSNSTHISLLGDPTLRMHIVKPAKNVRAQTLPDAAGRWITWNHSDDATSERFLGYYVCRATSPDGPFVRVTQDYVTGTAYTDAFTNVGQHTYMVRAIKKETTPSGTYINASTGVFVQTTGAKVLGPQFIYQTDHSVSVPFDRNVSSALAGGDLVLTRVGDDEFAATVTLTNYNSSTNTATFKFSGAFGSILPDGNYRATIVADEVALNDEPMTEDMVLDFFVLGGDANRDRTVNMTDYNIMTANFGQSGKTFSEGNFDYDPAGTVNMADFNILSANFGAVLNPPPSGPGQITVSVVSSNQMELTWIDDVEGETGWRVQRSADGTNFDWYVNLQGDKNSYTATNLQDGKKYWFRVRAYSDPEQNSGGPETAYTPKKSGITLLPAPSSLSVQLINETTASLTWMNSSQNATTVLIQRSTDGFNWTSIEQLASETAYDSSGLSSGMRYYFRIILKNDLIESAPSYVEYVDVL